MIGTYIIKETSKEQYSSSSLDKLSNVVWLRKTTDLDFGFFTSWNAPFCLVISSIQELKDSFHFLFHKNYFHHTNYTVLFLKGEEADPIRIQDILTSQGYHKCILISLDKLAAKESPAVINTEGLPIQFGISVENIFEHVVKNNLIYLNSIEEFYILQSKYQELNKNNDSLKTIIHCLNVLQEENVKLKTQLSWTRSQLENHKTYLEVLKDLVKNGSDFAGQLPNNKLIRFLKKFGPIRKGGKYIYKKYKSI